MRFNSDRQRRAMFANMTKFSAIPLSKEVRTAYRKPDVPKSKLGKAVEDVLLYPGAKDFNPITAFDDDYKDFNEGRLFNSHGKGVTDWKKV